MADFETAYYLTNKIEGGYANDKDDKGGETYRGIARNFHPSWEGWKVIDLYKKEITDIKDLNRVLDSHPVLQLMIQEFYKKEFWDEINGDLFPDQRIANEVYDNAVNMGPPQSGIYLQRTINALNRNQRFYNDIKVDGQIGPKTIEALKSCIKNNGGKRVLNVINGFQIKHYLELMEKNTVNEKYIGWFDRVEIVWH